MDVEMYPEIDPEMDVYKKKNIFVFWAVSGFRLSSKFQKSAKKC